MDESPNLRTEPSAGDGATVGTTCVALVRDAAVPDIEDETGESPKHLPMPGNLEVQCTYSSCFLDQVSHRK